MQEMDNVWFITTWSGMINSGTKSTQLTNWNSTFKEKYLQKDDKLAITFDASSAIRIKYNDRDSIPLYETSWWQKFVPFASSNTKMWVIIETHVAQLEVDTQGHTAASGNIIPYTLCLCIYIYIDWFLYILPVFTVTYTYNYPVAFILYSP